jgi:hypothetical protein
MPSRAYLHVAGLLALCVAAPLGCSVDPVESVDGSGHGGSAVSGHGGSGGQAGTTGAAGGSGTSGAAGQAGTSGGAGTGGVTGAAGHGGTTGVAGGGGASGAAGQAGTSGAAGHGGTSGAAGQAGTSGAAGGAGSTGGAGQAGTAGRGGTTGAAGTGGATGGGGAGGGKTCTQLETDYTAALTAAKMCNATAGNQCQILVSISLACPTCKAHVNDDAQLTALKASYDQAGCSAMPHICPAIACVNPGSGACVPINSGDFCM